MNRIFPVLILALASAQMASADVPFEASRLDGEWKLDWDRSDSFKPVMKALEVPWLMRQLAGVASVGLELRSLKTTDDCVHCSLEFTETLSSPISSNEVHIILDGAPRPGKDPRGRETIDRYTWSGDRGMEMIRELELPSGSQARLRETRTPGDSPDDLLSTLTVWVEGVEQASIKRTFVRVAE